MNYQEILIEKIKEYLSALASVISGNSINNKAQPHKLVQKFAIELSLQNHHKKIDEKGFNHRNHWARRLIFNRVLIEQRL